MHEATGFPGISVSLLWDKSRTVSVEVHLGISGSSFSLLLDRLSSVRLGSSSML